MRNAYTIILLFTIAVLGFISCEDQSPEIDGLTPYVTAKFINQDSISEIDSIILAINADITLINDSTDYLDSLIQNGDSTNYNANFESLDEQKAQLNTTKNQWGKTKNTLKSGEVVLQWLSGVGASDTLTRKEDESQTTFGLPLNINADVSEFLLLIDSVEYGVSFQYERDTIYKEGAITIEASNIKLIQLVSFDSARFPCDTLNCKSYEATATLYY